VLDVAQGFDAQDHYSRDFAQLSSPVMMPAESCVRLAVPRAEQRSFFGDTGYAECFEKAIATARALGWSVTEIDFEPFLAAARLLYDGPWIAERYVALSSFLREQPDSVYPVTRSIIEKGATPSAAEAFAASYRLKALQRETESVWRDIDVLMTPTAGTIYRIEEVEADPIALNSNLGFYTNFVNLLDLAAIAVPAGFRQDGLPFGVTFVARKGSDATLLSYADRLHRGSVATVGAISQPWPDSRPAKATLKEGYIAVVVCGAHMEGLPLNHQLQERRAYLLSGTRTAPKYRFYALPGGPPKRPGLVRVAEGGAQIEVEVWAVPQQHFGSFVAGIPSPLGIGKVELEDGSLHCGFLCESVALQGARDITSLGSWRVYLSQG
jgi:allophanate hydrolase